MNLSPISERFITRVLISNRFASAFAFMNQSAQHLIKLPESRGYLLKRISGSHHIFLTQRYLKQSWHLHDKKDIPNGTFVSILKQIGISKEELKK